MLLISFNTYLIVRVRTLLILIITNTLSVTLLIITLFKYKILNHQIIKYVSLNM